MFESLGEKFDGLWRKLQGQGRISERNIEDALRDVRLAPLEADVNVGVVRDFVEAVKKDALGQEVLRSLNPEQHFIKLVHRELQRLLRDKPPPLERGGTRPPARAPPVAPGPTPSPRTSPGPPRSSSSRPLDVRSRCRCTPCPRGPIR